MQFSWVWKLRLATAAVVMRCWRVMVFEKPEVIGKTGWGDHWQTTSHKDCNNSISFLNTMYSLSLLPIISKQIRITATKIDNFFINEPCNFEYGLLISDISDHFPIFFNLKNFFCTNSSKNLKKGVHYRLVNQNTLSALDEMPALTNFGDIINNHTINEAMHLYLNRINNAFKLCFPIRTKILSLKNTTKPWISCDICANIKKRQNYYSLVRQNKISYQFYSRFINFVTNQIR